MICFIFYKPPLINDATRLLKEAIFQSLTLIIFVMIVKSSEESKDYVRKE